VRSSWVLVNVSRSMTSHHAARSLAMGCVANSLRSCHPVAGHAEKILSNWHPRSLWSWYESARTVRFRAPSGAGEGIIRARMSAIGDVLYSRDGDGNFAIAASFSMCRTPVGLGRGGERGIVSFPRDDRAGITRSEIVAVPGCRASNSTIVAGNGSQNQFRRYEFSPGGLILKGKTGWKMCKKCLESRFGKTFEYRELINIATVAAEPEVNEVWRESTYRGSEIG
jgi:hypothetical protein